MALFGRRASPSAEPVLVDPVFPFLGASQADRVRMLVHRSFGEGGVDMLVHPGVAVDAWGRTFDLAPVMAACHADERGPAAWAHVVGSYVDAALASPADRGASSLPDLPLDDLLAAVHPLLVHVHDVPRDAAAPLGVAPQLVEVLQLVLPERTRADDDEPEEPDDLERHTGPQPASPVEAPAQAGRAKVLRTVDVEQLGPPDEVRSRALRNLAEVTPEWSVIERDGGRIDVITTPQPLAAALSALLPRLPTRVERKAGPVDPRLGVFFAVPFAGQLDLHVLRDGTARTSLEQLALFAAAGFTDVVGQISPDVYWWHAGRVERLTHLTPEGVAIVHLPELDQVLDELSGPLGRNGGLPGPTV